MSGSGKSGKEEGATHTQATLDLPSGVGFRSKGPSLTLEQIIELSELLLPFMNSQPDCEEKRLRTKGRIPFRIAP